MRKYFLKEKSDVAFLLVMIWSIYCQQDKSKPLKIAHQAFSVLMLPLSVAMHPPAQILPFLPPFVALTLETLNYFQCLEHAMLSLIFSLPGISFSHILPQYSSSVFKTSSDVTSSLKFSLSQPPPKHG